MLPLVLLLSSAASLAAPAPDTVDYVVVNHGRPAGEMVVIAAADSVVVKYHHVDRNRGPRSEAHYRLSGDQVVAGRTWNLPLYNPPAVLGAPADWFEIRGDSVFWRGEDGESTRRTRLGAGATYRLFNFTAWNQALLARFLLAQPGRTGRFLPSNSTSRLTIVGDTSVETSLGRQHVRLAMMRDDGREANGVWLDDRNQLFADQAGWFVAVRRGAESSLPALRAIEMRWRDANGDAVGRRLAPPPASVVLIANGDLFDSERGVIRPRTSVLIRGDRIVAVAPAESLTVPTGATVIDAAGKTVIPGMWDMHSHSFPTTQTTRALLDLASGITTIRDVAADLDVALSYRDRANRGQLAAPHVILGGFLDGPGRWNGPTEAIVSTEAEALAWVARYDSLGYQQIKLYNLIQQDLVPVIAQEAHRRGMRVSGHVARGLSTPAAVQIGYDEINHIAFLLSTFYPDSLYVPQMRAYSAVSAAVAPNFDPERPDFTAMLQLFKARGTVIDPTVNLFLSARAQGGVAPPNVGIPAQPSDSAAVRADRTMLRIIKRLYDAGITIVAGTDGSNFNSELENYEKAGIPPVEVLRIATIVPARVMKADADYGSIAPGKVADLFIVDGKPAERVVELRKVERVVRAGRLYEPRALRAAVGTGRAQ